MPPLAPLVHGSGGTIVVVSRNFVDTLEALVSPSSAFRSVVSSCIMIHEKQEVDRQTTGSQPVSEFAEVGMGEIVEGSSNLGM